jgi:cardiolipin synthase
MDFELGSYLPQFTWSLLLTVLVSAYGVIVAIFILMENRAPQSTISWLFLLLVFPLGGLVIYLMFGRHRRAFRRPHNNLMKLVEGTSVAARAAEVLARQPAMLEGLARSKGEYARIAAMLWATTRSPLTLENRIDILQDAREKYPRLLDDLRSATHSIHLLYYEWASDRFTKDVADVLAAKVKEGVEVRILYDPFGSLTMLSYRYLRRMREAGVRMYPFSPLYNLHTLSYRNHRKIAVIDGSIGYSGGLNMTEKHLTGPSGFSGWRDTHARLHGEVVPMLQGVFATMWHNTTGENLFAAEYFPDKHEDVPDVPIQVVSAGPDSKWEAIRQSYLAMIAVAERHVYLQSPFLILDGSVSEAMKTAALAGIDVRVMIAPRGAEFSPAYRAGYTYAADMARAGVKVLLYEGAYFHAKTVCVDSAICSIGSANMDIRSFSINYETNLVIYHAGVTRELEADFHADERHCVPFSADEYEARSGASRLLDSMLRLCSPLL